MSAVKKKSETCEEQLRRMCKTIAEEITDGKISADKWMDDVYDIEWTTHRDHEYRSARLLVAGGGSKNLFLMRQLQKQCCGVHVRPINEIGVPSQYREALVFATLSWWNFLGKKVHPKYITGANKPILYGVRVDP